MTPLNVLLLEDNPYDAELVIHELTKSGFEPAWRRVDTAADYQAALNDTLHVILADFSLPEYDALRALQHLQERKLDIPFIVVTGAIGEEAAVDCIRRGASDYLLKDRLTRLGQAVSHVLVEHRLREEKRRADIEIRNYSEQLRKLSSHIQLVREEESKRIAQRIHDELGQALTVLKMDSVWLKKHLPDDPAKAGEKIDGMIRLIDSTIVVVQRISMELRPSILDDLGLAAAMEWRVEEFRKNSGLACDLHIALDEYEPDWELATALFRILQEALINVARHAEATRVEIRLEKKSELVELTVADNGRGIAPEAMASATSFGLIQVRERAGAFGGKACFSGAPGQGTTLRITIPLPLPKPT